MSTVFFCNFVKFCSTTTVLYELDDCLHIKALKLLSFVALGEFYLVVKW